MIKVEVRIVAKDKSAVQEMLRDLAHMMDYKGETVHNDIGELENEAGEATGYSIDVLEDDCKTDIYGNETA